MGSKLKTLQIIHLAFCAGIFLFALVTILLTGEQLFFDANPKNTFPFNPLFPIMGLVALSLSFFLLKTLISKIDINASASSKIMQFQSAFIVSSALLEGGTFLNIVGCLITRNAFFLIFVAINLIFLIRNRPTKNKLISALQLQYPDTEAL